MLRLTISDAQFRELVSGREVILVSGPGNVGIAVRTEIGLVAMRQAVEAARTDRRRKKQA